MSQRDENRLNEALQGIADLFLRAGKENQCVGIFPHERHDADAFGSAMAMASVLEKIGCDTVVLLDATSPPQLEKLPRPKPPVVPERGDAVPPLDLALAVDSHELDRLGKRAPFFAGAPCRVIIDHHQFAGDPIPYSYLDSDAAATCELCYVLIEVLEARVGQPLFDRDIAVLLLAGMMTDTGRYIYSNTTPRVMRQAAALLERFKVDLPALNAQLFDQISYGMLQLRGEVYLHAKRCFDDRVIFGAIRLSMLEKYGVKHDDLGNIASKLRSVAGTEVAVLHVETEYGVRLNIRSGECFDASAFAQTYGGGGHARAAGADMKGLTLEEAMAMTYRDIGAILSSSR